MLCGDVDFFFNMAFGRASQHVLLAYCHVAQCVVRRRMRKVDAVLAASLDFVLAKEKKLASWVACNIYDVVDGTGQR